VLGSALGGSVNELIEPPVSRRDYEAMARLLDLDKDQRGAADVLFDGYLAGYKPVPEPLKDLLKKRTETVRGYTGQETEQQKMEDTRAFDTAFGSAVRKFMRKKAFVQAEFLSDLRSLLREDQRADRWPAVERMMRRKFLERALTRSCTTWNRVDLVACIDVAELPLDVRGSVAPQLEEYELALDRLLVRYARLYWSESGTWLEPKDDDLLRVGNEIGPGVAALNRKYTRWVTDLLPPESAEKLLLVVRARVYPSLGSLAYWRGVAEGTRRRIDRLPDLAADARERIAEIYRTWDDGMAAVQRWVLAEYDRADRDVSGMTDDELAAADPAKHPTILIIETTFERGEKLNAKLDRALQRELDEAQREIVWPKAVPIR
jgi:hypothetical protein